jgi:lactoylglutathione lyase
MTRNHRRPRLVGINHVALEVADIEVALSFWRTCFGVKPSAREPGAAFLDLGDQFLALMDKRGPSDEFEAHFGLVVDDKRAAEEALTAAGAEILPGRHLDFRDPHGNRIQVVQYDQIQFSKTRAVLAGMGLTLGKDADALAALRSKGLA